MAHCDNSWAIFSLTAVVLLFQRQTFPILATTIWSPLHFNIFFSVRSRLIRKNAAFLHERTSNGFWWSLNAAGKPSLITQFCELHQTRLTMQMHFVIIPIAPKCYRITWRMPALCGTEGNEWLSSPSTAYLFNGANCNESARKKRRHITDFIILIKIRARISR